MDALALLVNNPTDLVSVSRGILPGDHGIGAVNGVGIDSNFAPGVHVFYDIGAVAAGGTFDLKLQQSDSLGSGYADVTSASITQATAVTTGPTHVDWSGLSSKRYLRLVATVGTNTVDAAAIIMLTGSKTMPNPL